MNQQEMIAKIEMGAGFISALDQSGGSTPKALLGYGIAESEYSGDEEMFAKIHEMRTRIVTSPAFNGDKIIGAILFERTMDGEAGGMPMPELLKSRGVVPFLKVDKGLEAEADGVQLMKPMPDLDALLVRGKAKGVFGTKMRSVINSASFSGIAAIVQQQFDIGKQIIAHGLTPIIEPEYNIKASDRAKGEAILRDEIAKQLDALPADTKVMLKLSLPVEANLYKPLVEHLNTARVVALSGGFNRADACKRLTANEGMIASFSRALLEDLRAGMSDAEFDAALGTAIEEISCASAN